MDKIKMSKRLEELRICYIEQFGFDIIIGTMYGLNLGTLLRLEEILKNEKRTN